MPYNRIYTSESRRRRLAATGSSLFPIKANEVQYYTTPTHQRVLYCRLLLYINIYKVTRALRMFSDAYARSRLSIPVRRNATI
jgi:hypothetical protein